MPDGRAAIFKEPGEGDAVLRGKVQRCLLLGCPPVNGRNNSSPGAPVPAPTAYIIVTQRLTFLDFDAAGHLARIASPFTYRHMAFIGYVPPGEIPEGDRVPDNDNILQIHGVHSRVMKLHYDLYVEVMHRSSPLSRRQREMVATVVSATNGCRY